MDNNCNYPTPAQVKNFPGSMPALNHKEICSGCGRPIEDRFLLRVMDNSWHEHCLQCNICQEPLTRSCFVKDRKLFCKTDYDQLFGAKCKRCLQTIPSNELVMRALGNVYHLRCFSCIICGHQLQKGDQFVLKDGQLFCRLDFEKEFAIMPLSPKSDEDSSVEDNENDGGKGPKRPRTILTTSQRRKFKASFEINPKPCRKVRETLAAETGLSVRVVQVWFQNQRAKVKKLARRQTQDGSGDNRKSNGRSSKRPKKEEDIDGEGQVTSDPSIPSLQPIGENPAYSNQLRPYDSQHNHSPLYGSQPLSDSMYNSDSSMGLDGSLENLDEMLLGGQNVQNGHSQQGSLLNPIDKLYSMQSSYFSGDCN